MPGSREEVESGQDLSTQKVHTLIDYVSFVLLLGWSRVLLQVDPLCGRGHVTPFSLLYTRQEEEEEEISVQTFPLASRLASSCKHTAKNQ